MTNFSNRNIKTSDDLCCHLMTPCWLARPYRLSLPQIKQLHFMEIVNIEAGTFKEMVTSIQMLKEKLENLKVSWIKMTVSTIYIPISNWDSIRDSGMRR